MKKVFFIVILHCMFGCKDDTKNLKYNNNFESVSGWFEHKQIIKGEAYSGSFLCFTNSEMPYSITFRKKLTDLNNGWRIQEIVISAWVKFSKLDSKAVFVISIDKPDNLTPIIYNAEPLQNRIKEPGKWEHVNNKIIIPPDMDLNNIVSIYVWNIGNSPVYVDDISYDFH